MTIAARNSGSAIRTIISDDPGEGTLPHFPAVVAVPRRLNMLIPMHSRIDLAHVRQDRSIERAVAARHRRWSRGGGLPVFAAKTPIQRGAQPGTAGHPRKPPDRRESERRRPPGSTPSSGRRPQARQRQSRNGRDAPERCIVPVDGFFEWHATREGKRPYAVAMQDGSPFGIGGL